MPRRRATKIEVEFASEAETYTTIVAARAELLALISKGYGAHGARETLAACRERVQALADKYPVLWERACTKEK
jgi:hypothetical protein